MIAGGQLTDIGVLVIWGLVLAVFGGYTRNVQLTTQELGKALGADLDSPTGLQDAITPRWQTRNNMLVLVVLALFAIQAFVSLPWYLAATVILAVFFVGIPLTARTVIPRPMSRSIVGKIKSDLVERRLDYQRNGDVLRVSAVDDLLSLIEDAEKDVA